MDNFKPWIGVVESRQDNLKLGRCKVRVFGEDTQSDQNRDSLPYAIISNAPNVRSNKTPYEGDWVWGFYLDGDQKQKPIICGVMHGINSEISTGGGFSDSRTQEEIDSSPSAGRYPLPEDVGKPTTSKYYRGEDHDLDGTLLKKIKTLRVKNIPTADNNSWSQPEPAYKAVCPYNDVKESESGHLVEIDDTPNAERINIAHRTGTYTEYRPDGSLSEKIEKDKFTVVVGDDNVCVSGSVNLSVTGNVNIIVNGNVKARIIGQTDIDTQGNVNVTTQGNMDVNVRGNTKVTSQGDMNLVTNGQMLLKSPSKITLDAPLTNATKDIKANNDVFDKSGGKSMIGMREIFNSHTHPETQSTTRVPNQKM